MIDYEEAKKRVLDWLSNMSKDLGIPIVLDEDQTVEEEWGWIFHWKLDPTLPIDSLPSGFNCVPYLVDRITGHIRQVSTAGLRASIIGLLKGRDYERK